MTLIGFMVHFVMKVGTGSRFMATAFLPFSKSLITKQIPRFSANIYMSVLLYPLEK